MVGCKTATSGESARGQITMKGIYFFFPLDFFFDFFLALCLAL